MSREITTDEARLAFLGHAAKLIDYWADQPGDIPPRFTV